MLFLICLLLSHLPRLNEGESRRVNFTVQYEAQTTGSQTRTWTGAVSTIVSVQFAGYATTANSVAPLGTLVDAVGLGVGLGVGFSLLAAIVIIVVVVVIRKQRNNTFANCFFFS